jgi:NADPH-dependent glutamate synthase beta subunit-like oxidoreductase
VDFLRTVGGDESYQVSGRTVVVGGGNVAIDVARSAHRCGAESVSMYCLEPRDRMPASEEEIAEAAEEGVTLNCGWGPKEILTENGKVRGIVFKRCVSVWDAEGRFNPTYDDNDTVTVECEHVFLSIGQSIQWGNLLSGTKVELGRGQAAVADSLTYQTGESDIFVGGDVYTGPKFAIDAIAAGREGAISIHRFVQPHSSLTIGRNRRQFIELDKDNILVEQYDNASRQRPGTDATVDAKTSFRDARLPFTEEQVKTETARCLSCGASVVDPNKCIGCGVCTTKCEFNAIKLYRERPECSTMIPSEAKLKYVLGNGAKQALKIKFSGKKGK